MALEMIHGNYKDQFMRLNDYATELIKTNPDSTITFKLDRGECQRDYVCFATFKKERKEGSRTIIGLDSCFFKVPIGGQFLSSIEEMGIIRCIPWLW